MNIRSKKGNFPLQIEKTTDRNSQDWTKGSLIGFKFTHISVSEGAGKVHLVVQRRMQGERIKFGVRTVDDTATDGIDYRSINEELVLESWENEKTIEIEIVDDDQWEPDVDFNVELYNVTSGSKLDGTDAICKVTVIDDDEPGVLSVQDRHIKVRAKDEQVKIIITR